MALEIAQIALLRSRSLPVCADGDMVFKEPWEARAFALVVTLCQAGYFTWAEWVDGFALQVTKATDMETAGKTPKTYYEQWVDAAESLLVAKGLAAEDQLFARRLGALQPSAAQHRPSR
jgi:nitrile hydratase accessory protein